MNTYDPTDTAATGPITPIGHVRLGMLLFVSSEIMLFVGLLAGYVVLRFGSRDFAEFPEIPSTLPTVNTVVIVLSSLALWLAARGYHRWNRRTFQVLSVVTLVLGTCFLVLQVIEWNRLGGLNVIDGTNVYRGMFYVLSGVHGAHVLGGLGVLAWLVRRAVGHGADRSNAAAVVASGLYWHFVTMVWVSVYLMIFIIR